MYARRRTFLTDDVYSKGARYHETCKPLWGEKKIKQEQMWDRKSREKRNSQTVRTQIKFH